jgi:glycerol-3-phosphate dehydrogenase
LVRRNVDFASICRLDRAETKILFIMDQASRTRDTRMSDVAEPLTTPDPTDPDLLACDLLVVGGGVNGVGIARDAAGRGLAVVLCEKDDLAAATSSSSTKLIHGGLRYLEHYEFMLVRKALIEREVLLRAAPHIMWPLRFVLPHHPAMRPRWMIRAGMFLYDHLARREWLPGSETLDLTRHATGAALQPKFKVGFAYSDGWVDDARLVVLCAIDAAERGARILTRTRCTEAVRQDGSWQARLTGADGRIQRVRARAMVNAAGPWAEQFLREAVHADGTRSLRLVKGSHIVVRRLFDHPFAYIFQGADNRIVFAIPYENDFTLIGTTDVEHHGDPGTAAISADETAYLCQLASGYFRKPIVPADVVWSYSGVRPLLEDASGDPSAVTRDYALELNTAGAPLLTVWGGKLTTFRKLAEEATDALEQALRGRGAAAAGAGGQASGWTAQAPLPGGDLSTVIGKAGQPERGFDRFVAQLRARLPRLDAALLLRLARAYGTRALLVLGAAEQTEALGAQVAPGLYEAELRYLVRHEWARTGADVLWRRSKLGLHLSVAERTAVDQWMERNP